jgi:hypothetical protein
LENSYGYGFSGFGFLFSLGADGLGRFLLPLLAKPRPNEA